MNEKRATGAVRPCRSRTSTREKGKIGFVVKVEGKRGWAASHQGEKSREEEGLGGPKGGWGGKTSSSCDAPGGGKYLWCLGWKKGGCSYLLKETEGKKGTPACDWETQQTKTA